nr:YcaO-like family protein [Rhizobium sp. SSA_523]
MARVTPFLSRLGITRVSNQTGLDRIGIPVWCAFAPNAKAIVIAQGKGVTDDDARISAVMEAVERSVATMPTVQPLRSSLRDFQGSGSRSDSLNEFLGLHSKPLPEDGVLDWVEGRHLVSGQAVWLPYEAVHLDRSDDDRHYWQSSDGLASGNTAEEATFHGLMERIERDALVLWETSHAAQRWSRRIDPASIEAADVQSMLKMIDAAALDIALFDMTSDLGFAAMAAILAPRHRPRHPPLRHVEVTLGCGAGLQPELAASRAISEAVQSRMTFIAGARDDLLPALFEDAADTDILEALDVPVRIALASLPSWNAAGAADALKFTIQRLSDRGIDRLYAVDLAPDWLPASVVKVVVPQLESPDGDRRQRLGLRALSKALL